MAQTDIMYPNEMIKNWLARHNGIDGKADASLGSGTSNPKTKYPTELRDCGSGTEDRAGRCPKPNIKSPTSKALTATDY